ncbi:unnamed protein product [Adineta ricciae]|uniref:Uncharacterized protein n=1 Tax=Adineta ricciae TaxID=249248 RepID=A0A815WZN8_ADIRI|nr:unnamed protein product [Adineta ricciae]CAF1548388.1 unnamed protein product [Adineta ricciae]
MPTHQPPVGEISPNPIQPAPTTSVDIRIPYLTFHPNFRQLGPPKYTDHHFRHNSTNSGICHMRFILLNHIPATLPSHLPFSIIFQQQRPKLHT